MPAYDEAAVRAAYPQMAYLLGDPEIADKLRRAYEEEWPDDKFQAEIMSTAWWKTTNTAERDYQLTKNADPASFDLKLEDYRRQTRQIAGNLGYDLDAGYIDYFANQMYRKGLDSSDLQAMMVDEITPLIGTTEKSPILAMIRQASQDYGIIFDTPTLNHWLQELGSGRQSVDNLRASMQAQMVSMFPHLANQFQQGQTWRQITDPYKAIIADTLELGPEQVDFMGDPKWREVVSHVDEKGVTRMMSMTEVAKHARSQKEWAQTKNFQDRSDNIVRSLKGVFGA
jgi:hypothetical protein